MIPEKGAGEPFFRKPDARLAVDHPAQLWGKRRMSARRARLLALGLVTGHDFADPNVDPA